MNQLEKQAQEASSTNFVSPIYGVRRIKVEDLEANSFNPNVHATDTMDLLYTSIKEDGFTQPLVAYKREDGKYEIVDGYHRYLTIRDNQDIYDREGGCAPVVVVLKTDEQSRKASTIRHNKARGTHDIGLTSKMVQDLVQSGMGDDWIKKNLGMDQEELVKMKQVTGLTTLFTDKEYTKAWVPVDKIGKNPGVLAELFDDEEVEISDEDYAKLEADLVDQVDDSDDDNE